MFALGSSVSVFIQTVRGCEKERRRNLAKQEEEEEKKKKKKEKKKSKICNSRSIESIVSISFLYYCEDEKFYSKVNCY